MRKPSNPPESSFRAAALLGVGLALAFAPVAGARDLLRPGTGGSAQAGKAVAGGRNAPGSVAAAQAGKSARDMLARTSQVLRSVKDMQTQARAQAQKAPSLKLGTATGIVTLPPVNNGLGNGGLKLATGVPKDLANPVAGEDASLWQGAKLPVQSQKGGDTLVTITQTKQQALLNWETFNVGKQTEVHFDQQGGRKKSGGNDWIAINKITDPSGVPSQILGSITGDGAVYLINPNGIIFGGTSQVNVHSLAASSLPINDNLLTRGLLNNPDAQFLFSSLAMPAGSNGTPAFTPVAPSTADGRYGDVVVQPGARLQAPTTPDHVGGRIALIAPNVLNEGRIDTPDGQTILAAGLQVGFGAHASSDATLRGLDVYIGAIAADGGSAYAGTATNRGLIEAFRADVTLAGQNVRQLGVINSSTSVSLNGRIDLLASYDAAPYPINSASGNLDHAPFLSRSTGTVLLGAGSVSRVVPEYDSKETVVGTKLALDSQVKIQGKTIALQDKAILFAPSATVNIDSGVWKYIGGNTPISQFVYAGGQIHMGKGATINVAGSAGIEALVSENIITAELRGAELADSPLQRDGLLRGLSVSIDVRQSGLYNGQLWVGSPLFNALGYVGLIQRPVGELTTAGGTVNLRSGGSVIMRPGSTIDASGGYIDYKGALVKTTRVVSGSSLLDISQATPDMVYDGFYTGTFTVDHPKYGLSETFTNPLLLNGEHFEQGYVFGGDGGTINIAAPAMALDGNLRGRTIAGPRQRSVAPALSSLSLAFRAQQVTEGSAAYPVYSPTPPAIVFENALPSVAAPEFAFDATGEPVDLADERKKKVSLSPELLGDEGFGKLTIVNTDGDVSLPRGTVIEGTPRGALSISAANLDLQGSVVIPSGALTFLAYNISPALVQQLRVTPGAQTPPADPARGTFTLGVTSLLSTAGLLVDDRVTTDEAFAQSLATNGGSVAITGFKVDLSAGSTIDVSGGAAVATNGRTTYGDGGSIAIKAGQDVQLAAVRGGQLQLGAELKGFAGGKGGSLSIQTPAVQVGGEAAPIATFHIAPDFFSQGGFAQFTLTGTTSNFVAPGTVIAPVVTSSLAQPSADDPERLELVPYLKPEELRSPVSITLASPGIFDDFTNALVQRGDVVFSESARIEAGALGQVTLRGQTVMVHGSIFAPGGGITIAGSIDSARIFPTVLDRALVSVDIGSKSVLSTAGATLLTADPRGYRTGSVLPGGQISITGNIVTQAGALLDVSGASDTLDFRPAFSQLNEPLTGSLLGLPMVPIRVESAAGAIALTGGEFLFNNATLLGAAGGPTAIGGTISVSSGRFVPQGQVSVPTDVTLEVTQSEITRFRPLVGSAIGQSVRGQDGQVLAQFGRFTVGEFVAGGFDSLTLGGTVKFTGPISIAGRGSVAVATSGVLFADSAVEIAAPRVALGQAFIAPRPTENQLDAFQTPDGQKFVFDPTFGKGSLTVKADLIEIGNLSLQKIGSVKLLAPGGEVRGDGTFDMAGRLQITAGQVYVPTAVTFTIAVSDYSVSGTAHRGSIKIVGAGDAAVPLSAGGTLNIYASEISQGGVLRAPMGTINLGWDGTGTAPVDPITGKAFAVAQNVRLLPGSITSVSAGDLLIPYGLNLNGTSWVDPRGTDITLDAQPQKSITIAGRNVDSQKGAVVDVQGGGDLYAYRFAPGIGGSQDILGSTGSFAVLPGYGSAFVPYAPFSDRPLTTNLGADPGYVNGTLKVGDQVFLGASAGLPEGQYTLLPARYALLPGAVLVTPKSGLPNGTVELPTGAALVSGYRINGLADTEKPALLASFEVAPQAVIRSRAEYQDSFGNQFFKDAAIARDLPIPRLPQDAGHLIFQASQAMTLQGDVLAGAPAGARAGLVDISSPVDVVITGGASHSATGKLILGAADLNGWGAESLLIGGTRVLGNGTAKVTVTTDNITVANTGTPLSLPDLILVANKELTIAPGAVIASSGSIAGGTAALQLGASGVAGSGDGVLVRVSSDPAARVSRTGVSASMEPKLTVGAGARLSGTSLILDSTFATDLDEGAVLQATNVTLNSGQVSIVFDENLPAPVTEGLVLSGAALRSLQTSASSLSLLSYSTLDFYGAGQVGSPSFSNLALHAGTIRGYGLGANDKVQMVAANVILDNAGLVPASAPSASLLAGALEVRAGALRLGAGALRIDSFSSVLLTGAGGLRLQKTGSLAVAGNLTIQAPAITAAQVAEYQVTAAVVLRTERSGGLVAPALASGLGASISLTGGSLIHDGVISLPSGNLTLRATTGDLTIGGVADASGTEQIFVDVIRYTDAGTIKLIAQNGDVSLGADSRIDVSAATAGGDAGLLSISAPTGTFTTAGTVLGKAGTDGLGGSFEIDAGQIASGSVAEINTLLDDGGFDLSRDFRFRTGDIFIDGSAKAARFRLSADSGTITVTGDIDASGARGGSIYLAAGQDLIVDAGASLTVAGQALDAAGHGGSISLETKLGTIEVRDGATLNLSGSGVLHLRAPQINGGTDVAIAPLGGTITGAASVVVEGVFVQDANVAGDAALENFQAAALANAQGFMANEAAIRAKLLSTQGALDPVLHVRPGEEIVNSQGGLTLDSDWDLSLWRFGTAKQITSPDGQVFFIGIEPGVLTLRAKDSITLKGSIADGFGGTNPMPFDVNGNPAAWKQLLLPLFDDGTPQASWSYRLTAGADLGAVDARRVVTGSTGSLLLGRDAGVPISNPFGEGAVPDTAINPDGTSRYQVIRTGAGSIDIAAAGDVKLLNQFATIYSAGALVADPTLGGHFDVPILFNDPDGAEPLYPAQFSSGGGDVTITAGGNIAHETLFGPDPIPDAGRQLPVNWLYRRGYVDPVTGQFGTALFGDVASTAWWIDFSNYFQGIGALGGGDVSMIAGGDITNVDAVIPTNARMPKDQLTADALIELGGGDLLVKAGHDIDAGVYYVERGAGRLEAGNTIHTNSERAPTLGRITGADAGAPETWLPTTLFAGKASFDVTARGDLLLGPVANPFLLPSGAGNSFWYKTYFSTFSADSSVNVSSLAGAVTLRQAATVATAGIGTATPLLTAWLQNELLFSANGDTAAYYQPWLKLSETSVAPFTVTPAISPATFRATSFSNSINIVGDLTLAPAARGTLELAAATAINGLQPSGVSLINGVTTTNWNASTLNLSDANPANVPGVISPFAYQAFVGSDPARQRRTESGFLTQVEALFNESGSSSGLFGVLQTKQNLHAPGPLHLGDTEPVRLVAREGDISGVTLFSGKFARVLAGRDVSDIALYIQNTDVDDISVVATGRDIIAYNPNSPLRVAARASGNVIGIGSDTLAGDLQISGPGLIEVLAGRNLDLGVGPSNADGTGLGLVSIGNARNPFLPFEGASIIAGAGLGFGPSLAGNDNVAVLDFLKAFLATPQGVQALTELASSIEGLSGGDFHVLSAREQETLALRLFFLALRDAGRDFNNPASPNFGGYTAGFAAITSLFPGTYLGDISLTSREIKTRSGGDISLIAPGGQLVVGFDISGNQPLDQGILTEDGGNISIFTNGSVIVGTSRIFTLRGGDEIIWSSAGDIAAGASSKTVQSAPPTRVLVDPQTADVETDLAGLATGGGIGVLATVTNVPPGNVDLIAPTGVIDAGDAGIRATGNLNLAAVQVLNASNISVGGSSAGAPAAPVVAAPNLAGISAASSTAGASATAASEVAQQNRPAAQQEEAPSIISVDISYTAGETAAAAAEQAREEEEERRRRAVQ